MGMDRQQLVPRAKETPQGRATKIPRPGTRTRNPKPQPQPQPHNVSQRLDVSWTAPPPYSYSPHRRQPPPPSPNRYKRPSLCNTDDERQPERDDSRLKMRKRRSGGLDEVFALEEGEVDVESDDCGWGVVGPF
jgi:hypothetical protein